MFSWSDTERKEIQMIRKRRRARRRKTRRRKQVRIRSTLQEEDSMVQAEEGVLECGVSTVAMQVILLGSVRRGGLFG